MALSLIFLGGCMLGYLAKYSLLACLWQEPNLRVHFLLLLTAHITANLHSTHAHCRSQSLRGTASIAVTLLFGIVTPLMHLVHLADMAVSWWNSQGFGKRPYLFPAPLDVILEGLAFACVALHLLIGLSLGKFEVPEVHIPGPFELSFEALLLLTLVTALVTTAAGLVLWDSTMSIKLSRDMYGSPGRSYGGGVKGGGLFLAHLAFRCSEVAGKSAILAIFASLWGPKHAAMYIALTYVAILLVLLVVPHREANMGRIGEAAILAWPLLFANLPQFIDCPKHSATAKSVAGLVCGLRAVELAMVFSISVAAVLLESELGSGKKSDEAKGAQGVLESLQHFTGEIRWALFFLGHYLCMACRWTICAHSHSGWLEEGEEAFWPPASSLAPLLLSAGCECPPASCGLLSCVASCLCCGCGGSSSQPRLRMEDFEIMRLIGCGEFGKVFQVKHLATQRCYAMKKLSKEFYAQRRMTDKAIREISTLSLARDSPFVVRLIYTIENSREWAMVMEYCPGGDLQQLLLAEGFPGLALDRTLWISAEVVLALEYLHSKGIVFRDLKLENVVLDRDGHAKLTDFGLAKQRKGGKDAVAEAEQAGGVYKSFAKTFCGSYGYAAPEVNPKKLVHGYAADLYSLGVLVSMMLMGGEVYRDRREDDERRLPPERPQDLQEVLGSLSFDFYWASHHLLQPVGAAHRVEVNLDGETILTPRKPRGVRRQTRPRRPPTTPEEPQDPKAIGRPTNFPALAWGSSLAAQRRWDRALDLVRVLTNEFPEQRGTVATIKRHAFFAQEIQDWRMVYPRSWLVDHLRDRVLGQQPSGVFPEEQLHSLLNWLESRSTEELMRLREEPDASLGKLLERGQARGDVEDIARNYRDLSSGRASPASGQGS